jgi:hypothetical protein
MTRRAADAIKRFLWAHPDWWILAASAATGVWMVFHGIRHAGHVHLSAASEQLFLWFLMIVAMMVPLVSDVLRTVAFRSLRRRRHRAMAGFLAGYLGMWTLAGIPALWVVYAASSQALLATGLAFLLAALWAASAPRRRALVACHRTMPLAPSGWRADFDCVRFGGVIGGSCVASCFPLMLACTLTGHRAEAMLAGATIAAVERLSFRTPLRAVAGAQATLAVIYLAPLVWR